MVTPDHTIRTKNWPLIVPAPEAGKLDEFKAAPREARRDLRRRYRDYFARNNARVGGAQAHARSAAPRRAGAGARPVRPRPLGQGRARSPPTSPKPRSTTITDAEAIGRFESITRSRHVRHGILAARTGQARQRRGDKPLAGQVVGDHRRGRRDRRRDRAAPSRRPAPRSRCSTSNSTRPRANRPRRSAARRAGRLRRDRRGVGARGLRPGRRDASAASTSWCRMPARPGRAGSARSTRPCCARASS